MSTDQQMYEVLWRWSLAAYSVLNNRPIAARWSWKLQDVTDAGHGFTGEQSPDFVRLVDQWAHLLKEIPETDEVLTAVKERPAMAEALLGEYFGSPSREQEISSLFNRCLAPFIVEQLRASFPSYPPDTTAEQVFSEVYDWFDEFINQYEGSAFYWVIHLSNIRAQIDTIELSDTVKLRRASAEEMERGQNSSHSFSDIIPAGGMGRPPRLQPLLDPHAVPHVVVEVADLHTLPRFRDNFLKPKQIGEKVVEGLRLVGSEPVAGHSIWRVDPNPFSNYDYNQGPWWFDYGAQWDPPGTPDILTPVRAEKLEELWSEITPLRDKGGLMLARRRFNDSYRRDYAGDKLLDYWIGLEALFLAPVKGELRFRAALRIARYLGETSDERRRLFRLARKSYDLRSTVAHGAHAQMSQDFSDCVESTGEILRRALRRSLIDGHAPNGIELDLSLLD